MSGKDTKELFHHTNEKGMKDILLSGTIKKSEGDRARYGSGAYFTSNGPDDFESKSDICQNNYGKRRGSDFERQGRADFWIKVDVPSDEAKEVRTRNRDRDVWKTSDDVSLYDKEWDAGVTKSSRNRRSGSDDNDCCVQ